MGPLKGVRVLEFAGLGPGPFCAMMLADMGADVVRVDRKAAGAQRVVEPEFDVLSRGRRSIAIDLKNPAGIAVVLRLVERCDALIEGFRPGVMERLGLGPAECQAKNPRLVYGRMTGWGQTGPLSATAGHDINYLAISGALHSIGTRERPVAPLNLVADFGGGGMMLAFGLVCGLLEARASGKGQVIDAAMSDGAALLMNFVYGMRSAGRWSNQRESNLVDGGMAFYGCYECGDGKFVAVGPIEPQFQEALARGLGVDLPLTRESLERAFRSASRDEWCARFDGTDACCSPVLDLDEAPEYPHNVARGTFVNREGVLQVAPGPRFSRTVPELGRGPCEAGADAVSVLEEAGFTGAEIEAVRAAGAI